MSLTPTNNVTPPPSPRENERLDATPTGRSPTTQATVTVVQDLPDNNAFLHGMQQTSPALNVFADALQSAPGHRVAPSDTFVLNTTARGPRRRLFPGDSKPEPEKVSTAPDFRRIAKNVADRVQSQLHMYSAAPELRVINRLKSASPEANIQPSGPSYRTLQAILQKKWTSQQDKIIPDDIVFHNALLGDISQSIARNNQVLFAIVNVVEALPNVDDQTKARYVDAAFARSIYSFGAAAADIVQQVMAQEG